MLDSDNEQESRLERIVRKRQRFVRQSKISKAFTTIAWGSLFLIMFANIYFWKKSKQEYQRLQEYEQTIQLDSDSKEVYEGNGFAIKRGNGGQLSIETGGEEEQILLGKVPLRIELSPEKDKAAITAVIDPIQPRSTDVYVYDIEGGLVNLTYQNKDVDVFLNWQSNSSLEVLSIDRSWFYSIEKYRHDLESGQTEKLTDMSGRLKAYKACSTAGSSLLTLILLTAAYSIGREKRERYMLYERDE